MSQDIQLNLINSKSSGLDVLFRIISSSNYREVGIKYITPVIIVSFSNYLTVTLQFWQTKIMMLMSFFYFSFQPYMPNMVSSFCCFVTHKVLS